MEFAEWLRTKLDEREINATQLAEIIKENQPTIQRILSGETRNPRYKLVKKIEDYFNGKFEPDRRRLPNQAVIIGGITINTNESNLIDMYRLLSHESQNTLDMMANRLLELEHPENRKASPFGENFVERRKANM
jgi:transcriptional regulator with XRE-family HTH domain